MRSITSAKVRSSSSGSGALPVSTGAAGVAAGSAASRALLPVSRPRARASGVRRRKCGMYRLPGLRRSRLSLRAAPLGGVARAALLADGEIQRRGILPAAGADCGDGVASFDDVAGIFQQALIMAVEAQVAIAVVED